MASPHPFSSLLTVTKLVENMYVPLI